MAASGCAGRETEEVTRPLATPTRVVPAHGSLGLPQGIALYIGSVLGTGLLVLPGIAAQVAGPGEHRGRDRGHRPVDPAGGHIRRYLPRGSPIRAASPATRAARSDRPRPA